MKKNLSDLIQISESKIKEFFSKFTPSSLNKGDYFIREGKVCRKLAFITKGCMMCLYSKDGKEYIDEFSLENEFITDYDSFLTGEPAKKDVICLENTELLTIEYEDLQTLYSRDKDFEKAGRLMSEMLFITWQNKAKSLLIDDAKTRYLKLIENRPSLPQRVPQYLVASYLGVSPETLSRIRRKIAKQ